MHERKWWFESRKETILEWKVTEMRSLFYVFNRLWASSSVSWPPWRTLLILSDGWECKQIHTQWVNVNKPNSTFFTWEREKVGTWWERAPETVAGDSDGGTSDQVSRSAVDVWGFLTGVFLSISQSFLSLSLSLRLRYFKKIWNFQIDKKNLGWCKNVIHQTYYYFFYFLRDWDIWGVQTSDSLSLTYLYVDMCYLLLKKII